MIEYIERDTVLNALHEIGGCDAPPDTWADGYDKAIDAAYRVVSDLPAGKVYTEEDVRNAFIAGFSKGAQQLWVEKIIWHEIASRALTDEEKAEYIERGYADYEVPQYMFTCEMPDDGQEVLIATSWGVSKDVCSTDSDELNYLYGLEDHGDWDGVLAWAAMPKYKGVE